MEETSALHSDVNDVSAIIFATENDAPQPLDIKGKSWTISSYVINVKIRIVQPYFIDLMQSNLLSEKSLESESIACSQPSIADETPFIDTPSRLLENWMEV